MGDFYLDHPEKLKGQPKRTIGDYVESQSLIESPGEGILVPKRDYSFEAAIASGNCMARSEHHLEYDGASGILGSPLLRGEWATEIKNEQELKKRILFHRVGAQILCAYLKLDYQQFKEELSFSYWEYVPGINTIIIADSAVRNKYHLMARIDNNTTAYFVVEDNKLVTSHSRTPEEFSQYSTTVNRRIELYERVRHLGRFDPTDCSLMEMVTSSQDDKDYFLQKHITRKFDPANFVLERELQSGEIEASFVRGKTPPEGITVKTTYAYAEHLRFLYCELNWPIPETEEASFDHHHNFVFSEVMSRRRKVQFKNSGLSIDAQCQIDGEHITNSQIFKPELTVFVNWRNLLTPKETRSAIFQEETPEDKFVNLHVVADGRKAYVKRV